MTTRVACIGARQLSLPTAVYLESVGAFYAEKGSIIASGNAPGADQAYARGALCTGANAQVELFLPWANFETRARCGLERVYLVEHATPDQIAAARDNHPAWHGLGDAARKLLTRNAMIVWHAQFVIAYPNRTREGWGGTGHAIRVATHHGIPTFLLDSNTWYQGGA